ncbi:MAG: hypothetical protein NVS3B3_15580 [Aquirhabdus sp.]
MSFGRVLHTLILGCSTLTCIMSGSLYAEDTSRFYTVIDEQGHMRSVRKDVPSDGFNHNYSLSPKKSPLSREAATSTLNGETYIDSEYLEKREFNLDEKKKFYAVPDGLGGTQIVERVPGAIEEQKKSDSDVKQRDGELPALVTLSDQYQRVPAIEITSLIGMKCLSTQALRQATIMRDQQLILWPRSDAPRVNNRAGLNYVVVEFRSNTRDLSLQSFAPQGRQSDYYWPLPIFLDADGCVLEGVNGFYQKTLPSTVLQPSILVGTLHVPEQTRFMMLTPLVEAIDLPKIKLSEVGQVRLIPLR